MATSITRNAHHKKNNFLVGLLVLLISLSACTGHRCHVSVTRCPDANLVAPTPSTRYKGKDDHGIYLTISKRSSLSIDVEGIVDYVQRELSMLSENDTLDKNTPWVQLDWHF